MSKPAERLWCNSHVGFLRKFISHRHISPHTLHQCQPMPVCCSESASITCSFCMVQRKYHKNPYCSTLTKSLYMPRYKYYCHRLSRLMLSILTTASPG
ncbi:hypothetical protein QL285_030720 [Trifolium repens]|nr:hypothetical protein QL285_030720 [Trifolium repens]